MRRALPALLLGSFVAAQTPARAPTSVPEPEAAKPAPARAPAWVVEPEPSSPAPMPAPPATPQPTPTPTPSPSAAPETFLSLRDRADEVVNLAETLEPYLQTCAYPEAYLLRQCEALKERLMFLGKSRLLRYAVPSGGGRGAAIVDGRQVVLRACLTCNGPAVVSEGLTGGGLVLGKLPQNVRTTVSGLTIDGIEMHRAQIPGDSDPAKVAPALVAEFVFRTRNEPPRFVARSKQPIVLVDVAGYRVFDRCTGKMYRAWPGDEGGTVAATEKTDPTCPGYVKPVVKVEEDLPPRLDDQQIKKVLEGAREDVLVCYDKYREGGYAPAKITVTGANGRIQSIAIGGKFEGTPTAQCIEKVMRAVTFPRFKEKDLQLDWQFFLQD